MSELVPFPLDDDPGLTPSLSADGQVGRPAEGRGFAPGEIVAGRFRVVEFIAHGGMGQVYRARDLELGEEVALKIVRPEMSADPRTLQRFREEARLARQVTHVNVCRVFDVFSHQPSEAGSSPVLVLTMELLRGETLANRLRRCTRLPRHEAFAILGQIASGLEAAHRAGILHLDLKSNNVFLVPHSNGERAVVADFGLAEVLQELTRPALGPKAPQESGSGEGSQSHSAATDVQALGMIAYQMLTGKRLTPAAKRGNDRDGLTRGQRKAIDRALSADPSKRFTVPSDLVSALRGRRARGAFERVLTTAALLLPLAALGWIVARRAENGARSDDRQSTAVLVATGPGPANAFTAELKTLLATSFGAGERLRVVTQPDASPETNDRDCGDSCLDAIGQKLGAAYVIGFKIDSLASPEVGFSLQARDLKRHRTVEVARRGGIDRLLPVVEGAVAEARERLAIVMPHPQELAAARALLPASAEGLRLYVAGKNSLLQGNTSAAVETLSTLTRLEPRYPMAHVALADALAALGYQARAVTEYRAALPLGGELPRRELLLIQARGHEAERRWDAAAAVYQALASSAPEDQAIQIALASALASGNRCVAAHAILAKLRQAGGRTQGSATDVQLSLAEATTSEKCHDWPGERASAQRALNDAQRLGTSADVDTARLLLATAMAETGDVKLAEPLLQEVRLRAERSGNLELQFGAERALEAMTRDRGDFVESERRLAGLIELAHRMRNPSNEGLAQRSLGTLYRRKGRLDDARDAQRRALALFESAEEHDLEALSLNSLALIAEMKNDYPEALLLYDQALPRLRAAGDAQGVGAVLSNTGRLRWRLGATQDAHREITEAARLFETHHDVHAVEGLMNLALLDIDLGEFKEAEAVLGRAAALKNETPAGRAWLNVVHAHLAFESGAISAEAELRGAAAAFRTNRDDDGEGWALSDLAGLQVDQGDFQTAMTTARQAEDACRKADDAPCWQGAQVMQAEAALQSGRTPAAQAALRSALRSPDKLVTLRARQVEAMLVAAGGNIRRGDRLLSSACEEAARSGFAIEQASCQLNRGRILELVGKKSAALEIYNDVAADCTRRGLGHLARAAVEAAKRLGQRPPLQPIGAVSRPDPSR